MILKASCNCCHLLCHLNHLPSCPPQCPVLKNQASHFPLLDKCVLQTLQIALFSETGSTVKYLQTGEERKEQPAILFSKATPTLL